MTMDTPIRTIRPRETKSGILNPFKITMRLRLDALSSPRWTAALAEHARYRAVDPDLRRRVLETFSRKARAMAARFPFLSVDAPAPGAEDDPPRQSIVALICLAPPGAGSAMQQAAALREALARPLAGFPGDAICHVGHPVPVGRRAALPVSASAPLVSSVARRLEAGVSFERAMAPPLRDLATLLRKWEAIAG